MPKKSDAFRSSADLFVDQLVEHINTHQIAQAKLATAAGVDRTVFSKIVNRERRPTVDQMILIARALERPDFLSETVRELFYPKPVQSLAPPNSSLQEFLKNPPDGVTITEREAYLLEGTSFRVEPWMKLDSAFWLGLLKFWREFLLTQDQKTHQQAKKLP